ncbi:LCP family protein [Agromyces kandeliae]|uniref:LytR family transcriptional regulator n=1 Tax=Agromyces kandeliae TaxID=2666141 RepID=A0A6L5QZM9_9MICO|nr:LCP family protein [Agromyces kandeliae]MRX43109.1 LytR family transcriptional regulator [Agromyces kandeliae]
MSDLIDAPQGDTPTDDDGVSDGHVRLPAVIPPPAPPAPRLPPVLMEATVPPAHHGRLPRRGAGRALAKGVGAMLAVALVASGAIAAYAVSSIVTPVAAKPSVKFESEQVLESVPDIGAMEGGLNFLLVGSDKRPASGAFGDPDIESGVLNDVTMLLHISQDHSHAEVVSFPRDLLVDVPECPDPEDPEGFGYSARYGVKINTILNDGGMGCIAKTLEQMLGITIPVGGVVEFDGVAALSEAVGGVEVCVVDPIDDAYTGLVLDPGSHVIKGYEALAFLRTRHAVGDGSDLARISSQQTFLASLARTLQSAGTLGDPVKLYGIARAVVTNMTLSSGLQDLWRLVSVARALQSTDLDRIAFIQYPTVYTDDLSAVVPAASASVVASALQQDIAVQFDPTATDGTPFGTVDPNATDDPAEEPVGEPSATPEAGDPAAPSGTATPAPSPEPTTEALPGDVSGQTAADVRCAAANTG